jgi:6-phosphogluconolactonase (cycloisomerase 2 family)
MAMKVRGLVSSVVLLTAIWLVSCGHYVCGTTFGASSCTASGGGLGTGGNGTAVAFDFFLNGGSINGAILDTSGNFTLINNFVSQPVPLSGAFGGMIVVQKRWLYATKSAEILAYSINGTTGALTAITGNPFAYSGTEAYSVTTDPAGKFLFVTGANDVQVWVFAINQTTGALTTVGSYPTAGLSFAAYPATDGLGKYLYVTAGNLGGAVDVFSIGATGSLTLVATQSVSIAVLQGEPTGLFMLGVSGNGANNGVGSDNHIYVYSINQSTGALTLVGSPFATTYIPSTLVVHPNGTLVYTFNQTVTGTSPGASPMEGFQLNTTTGALSALGSSPFTALTAPAGTFDQSGAYLFMHPGTSLTVASVNTTTGALSSISSPITAAGNPVAQSWAATDTH